MYIYLDKQGVVKEIINDEALRQSASNVNEIYVYYDCLQENDIGSVLATYGLPDGTITDEMEVATRTEESEIPYNAERDLKYFKYYQAYPFYHFAIADLALSQEGVVRLMVRLAQKNGEYIKVAGLICFDVEGELVKEDHGVSLAQYNYLVKAWYETKECLPLDGSKAMQGNIDMGAHNVILNGKTLKDNNGALNYNGSDLAKQSDTSSLQSQIDTINATQNVVDIVGTKAELNAYATKDLHTNDKIEVLADESQSNANTIYEWNGNAWSLVGSKAPYYSKAESDARYNELKAKSYDKDTASYVSGHVPDSALVKGSLDSVNEKVGALQTDNQTTKTTIAGLVSSDTTNKANIAKNTQDIATLKANYTEVQSQANTNSSDIALLESNAIKKDTDASLKSLTLPSASALKTKDGSSLSGGGDDIFEIDQNRFTPNSEGELVATLTDEEVTKILKAQFINMTGESGFILIRFGTDYVFNSTNINSEGIGVIGYILYAYNVATTKQIKMVVTQDELSLSNYATKTDLNAKQATLYRHTIEIVKDNEATLILTTESTISTEINTMDKFISAFKGSELACMCSLYDNNGWNIHFIGIQVGTTLGGTSMMSTNLLDTALTFTDVFGASGYEMVDKVKPL